MISYRDMTFCPFWESCRFGGDCDRAMTTDVIQAANRWWGRPGAPISQFMGEPDCHEPVDGAA